MTTTETPLLLRNLPAILPPPLWLTAAFVGIVAVVVLGYWWLLGRRPVVMATMLAWLGVTFALAHHGVLTTDGPLPAPFHRLMLASLLGTLLLCLSPRGRRLATSISLPGLVGLQAFRIPLELVLWQLFVHHELPVQMTFEGRNFDVLSGALAIPVALLAHRGKLSRASLLAWNALSLSLLLNIVQVALRSTPGTLRAFANNPPNVLVFEPPWVWLPTICVVGALAAHVLVFVRLGRSKAPGLGDRQ